MTEQGPGRISPERSRRIFWVKTVVQPIGFFRLGLAALFMLIGLFHAAAYAQSERDLAGKRILILHSHEANTPVSTGTDKGLSDVLLSGGVPALSQFYESLDIRRNPGPGYRRLLTAEMRMKYGHRRPDLIITMLPEALEFVLEDCRDIFARIPILALYLPQSSEVPKTDRPVIRHFPKVDITGTLEIALKLVPGAKRVYVVNGTHEVDRKLENETRRISARWEGRLQFSYLSDMQFETILTIASGAPSDSIILLLSFIEDRDGKSYANQEVAERLNRAASAPIFGVLDINLGHGITGGNLIGYQHVGAKAGELVLRLLRDSRNLDPLPVFLDVSAVPMFDWRQLRRRHLKVNALPEGSIVVNKELTLWDFKYYILGIVAFCLANTALVVTMFVQRRRKNEAEESLRKAEEKYRDIFENALEGIFESTPEGRALTANPALAKMLGYDSVEELTSGIKNSEKEIWENPYEREEFTRRVEKQGAFLGFRCRLRRKDGTMIWVSLSAKRVAGPDGKTLFYSGFLEDITWRKQSEQEAFDARKELLRMERLSRMGELSASLSHELNQPLMSILSNAGAASMLLEQGKLDPGELKEILHDIIQDDKRAGEIIHGLRSMVKAEEGEVEIIAMDKILHEAVALFNGEAIIRNIKIETDAPESLPLVKANRVQIEQVLINLMMNGAQAMEANPQANKRLVIRAFVIDSTIQVVVRDFGDGINPSEEKKLFEPFFTTKRAGMGLGLSLSRSIMEIHGGHVWAENNHDKGASFYFDIPIAKEEDAGRKV